MRFIDRNRFEACKTENWDENSEEWGRRVREADDPTAEIKKIGNKWTTLKANFTEEFGAKCWYTEVPQIGTDFDVDHYAPKGRVKQADGVILQRGDDQHPGYWWKAYDIHNYRLACIYANRGREDGGKVDYFPLTDEQYRSWNTDAGCDHAYRVILDPCDLDDVQLITFEVQTAEAASAYTEEQNPEAYQRVKQSKKVLNLNERTILNSRKKVIKDTRKLLFLLQLSSTGGVVDGDAEEIKEAKQMLIDSCDRKSPFSAAVVQTVRPYRLEPYLAEIVGQIDLEP